MSKTKPMQQLQDSLNELFGQRKAVEARIKHTEILIEERRLDKNALAKARRLAEAHDVELDRDRDGYWVTHPKFDGGEDDPCDGNHFCVGGREVLQAVEAYVEHLQGKGAAS